MLSWINYSYGTVTEFAFWLVFLALLLLRITYSYTVFLNAKRRGLDTPVYWAVMSFVAGTIAFILYFIVNAKQGEKSKPKKQQAVSIAVSYLLVVILFALSVPVRYAEITLDYVKYSNAVVEKTGFMQYVTYDKMGNEYSAFKLAIDEDGEYYVPSYLEDGTQVSESQYYLINSDGYAVLDCRDFEERFYETDEYYCYAFFDDEHNIYYSSGECSWDKDGNLVFKEEMYKNLTYENTEPTDYEDH